MSDVYQEITEAGRQEGLREGIQRGRREGALRTLARLMDRKFSTNLGKLEDVLEQCTEEDLDWLVDEALTVKQFATLRRHLEARLAQR
jgi:predicted transposase YdaD